VLGGDRQKEVYYDNLERGQAPSPDPTPPDQRYNRYGPVITVGGDFSETGLIKLGMGTCHPIIAGLL